MTYPVYISQGYGAASSCPLYYACMLPDRLLCVQHILDHPGVDPNIGDEEMETPLYACVKYSRRLDQLAAVVRHPLIDLDMRALRGDTPLHYILRWPSNTLEEWKTSRDIALYLVRAGANLDLRTWDTGETPYTLARFVLDFEEFKLCSYIFF